MQLAAVQRLVQALPLERRVAARRRLIRLRHPAWLGTVRRLTPVSDRWGKDRGTPIDRYYIEAFLEQHAVDIRGVALEIKDRRYTDRFGRAVECVEVLDVDASNPAATMVADLTAADTIPSGSFDCFILTQTLQFVPDVRSAVAHAHRILRSGGTLLVTVPTASRIPHESAVEPGADKWRFTGFGCDDLFGPIFGPGQVTVRQRGNVLTNVAFLLGMAAEELSPRELETDDPFHPLLVTVRAVKR